MTLISLPYDKSTLSTELPDTSDIRFISHNEISPLDDPRSALKLALLDPVSGPSLRVLTDNAPGNIYIICSDNTRADGKDHVLPWILDELNLYGVPDTRIKILMGTGTHTPPSDDVVRQILGDVTSRVEFFVHDQNGEFIDFGYSKAGTHIRINSRIRDADLLVTYSAVVHHYFAGYGGGRKAILPGIASLETIRQNHSLLWISKEDEAGRHPMSSSGILDGNPIADDMADCVSIVLKHKPHFSIQTVLSPDKGHYCFYCGDIFDSHRKACADADRIFMVNIDEIADVIISSSGGHPKDLNLIQAHKGMDNSVRALKPGGTLIYAMGCINGHGNPAVAEFAPLTLKQAKDKLVEKYVINGASVHSMKIKARDFRIIAISMLDSETIHNIGMEPAASLEEAISMVDESLWDDGLIYVIPRADLVVPALRTRAVMPVD